MRLISHRDLIRTVERLLRRAGLPLVRTEGFHPRPRMAFPSALSVGIAGTNEVLEIELSEELGSDELLARLTAQAVPGLRFLAVEPMPPATRAGVARFATYEIDVPEERQAALAERVAALLAAESWPMTRPHDGRTVELRAAVSSLALEGGRLRMRLSVTNVAGVSPRLVLAALDADDLETTSGPLTRTELELA